MSKRNRHAEIVQEALSRPEVKREYDALAEEFELLREMVKARENSGKTQDEVAKSMNTSTSVVGRLETGGGKKAHSPTIDTLRRYANAIGCKLMIKFVPENV